MDGSNSRQGIIAQLGLQYGRLTEYDPSALDQLVQQRRVFNRMDWWSPYEWLSSDTFFAAGSDRGVVAAVLAIPASVGSAHAPAADPSQVAWVRWCAVANGVSATKALTPLLQHSAGELAACGIARWYALVEPLSWLTPYLREAHFRRVDDVVTMVCREPSAVGVPASQPAEVVIRPAEPADIAEVAAVDQSAFDEQWQYPLPVLRRALESSVYFTVAVRKGELLGYQFATSDGQDAHITRLAVRADWQGRGIGGVMLADALRQLTAQIPARFVTLNTQASNVASQNLYVRFGFQMQPPSMQVLCRELAR